MAARDARRAAVKATPGKREKPPAKQHTDLPFAKLKQIEFIR